MPSRRQFIAGCTAVGLTGSVSTVSAANATRPTADVDAALTAFGSGTVEGRLSPDALGRVRGALDTVAREAPGVADAAAGRLPTAGDAAASAAGEGGLDALEAADLYAASAAPGALGDVAALAVGVDFTARGPVLRARVTGEGGAPARAVALDALARAGLPVADVDGLMSVPDGDDLALVAGFDARDDGQPLVLALLLVVLAAIVGTFVLGLSGSASGGGSASGREAPQVAFAFEYDSTGRVTITHQGGDSVEATALQVVYTTDGSVVNERWRDDDGTVQAGDTFTTSRSVDSGTRLRVVWSPPEGGGSVVLAAFEAP